MKYSAKSCAHCRFGVIADAENGHCRRVPPRAMDQKNSAFPVISPQWWCGEYRRHWRRFWRRLRSNVEA